MLKGHGDEGLYGCDGIYHSNFRRSRGWLLVTGAGFGAPENVRLVLCDRFGYPLKEAVRRFKAFMEK